MVMRHLASIKTIRELHPIEGADRVECAVIEGWDVVVKKGEFKVGDPCVYCECDSILPKDNPNFAFLEGRRIKIKRLRGIYSYGIAFPLTILPTEYEMDGETVHCWQEGDDVSAVIGVEKWEPEVITGGNRKQTDNLVRVPFPAWIPKTDETRFQSIIDILKPYEGIECVVTEKLDGCSTTHWLDDEGNYHIASRNREIVDKNEIFYRGAIEAGIPDLMKELPKGTVVQGELIGPGIAGNKYNLDKFKIYMFNSRWQNRFAEYKSILDRTLRNAFDTVPVIDEHYKLRVDKDHLLELSMGKSVLNPKQEREGIVIRPRENIYITDRQAASYFVDGRLSFKVINPKFELKN